MVMSVEIEYCAGRLSVVVWCGLVRDPVGAVWCWSGSRGVVVVGCLVFVLARWDEEGVVGESGEEEGVVGDVL